MGFTLGKKERKHVKGLLQEDCITWVSLLGRFVNNTEGKFFWLTHFFFLDYLYLAEDMIA